MKLLAAQTLLHERVVFAFCLPPARGYVSPIQSLNVYIL